MKRSVVCIRYVIISCCCCPPVASSFAADLEPFEKLDEMTQQASRWEGSKMELAEAFNSERDRLGDTFQDHLLKFVGDSHPRHYWCGVLLTTKGYLGKRPPYQLVQSKDEDGPRLLFDTSSGTLWAEEGESWVLHVHPPHE